MIKLNLFYGILIGLIAFSCSSDDNNNDNQVVNEMMFNSTSYPIVSVLIYDENNSTDEPRDIGINLFNYPTSEIFSGNDLTDITAIYFDFNVVELEEKTYTEIIDYEISINGTRSNGNFSAGTILLADTVSNTELRALNSTVTINDLTDSTIDLSFSFTRNDGQVISGNYKGTYSKLN